MEIWVVRTAVVEVVQGLVMDRRQRRREECEDVEIVNLVKEALSKSAERHYQEVFFNPPFNRSQAPGRCQGELLETDRRQGTGIR